ncbi:hypothetical protein ABKN59_004735 [Abortiporus biennis]
MNYLYQGYTLSLSDYHCMGTQAGPRKIFQNLLLIPFLMANPVSSLRPRFNSTSIRNVATLPGNAYDHSLNSSLPARFVEHTSALTKSRNTCSQYHNSDMCNSVGTA